MIDKRIPDTRLTSLHRDIVSLKSCSNKLSRYTWRAIHLRHWHETSYFRHATVTEVASWNRFFKPLFTQAACFTFFQAPVTLRVYFFVSDREAVTRKIILYPSSCNVVSLGKYRLSRTLRFFIRSYFFFLNESDKYHYAHFVHYLSLPNEFGEHCCVIFVQTPFLFFCN